MDIQSRPEGVGCSLAVARAFRAASCQQILANRVQYTEPVAQDPRVGARPMNALVNRSSLSLVIMAILGVGALPRLAHSDELFILRSGEYAARSASVDKTFGDAGDAVRGGDPCTTAADCPSLPQPVIDDCGAYFCEESLCVLRSTCTVLEICDGAANCLQNVFFDANLTYLAGPENAPFEDPFTIGNFQAARAGQAPQIGESILDGCGQFLPADPDAKSVHTGIAPLGIPHTSALYAIDFEVVGPVTGRASIDLFIRPNDALGGGPNQGVFLNTAPLSGDTTGSICGVQGDPINIFRDDIRVNVGTNTLYFNVTHTEGNSGLLFYAKIRVDNDSPLYVHVDEHALPGGDGTSWATAFTDLQDALDAAETSADPNREIWLAGGTYTPSRLEDPNDPRSMTFRLLENVDIIGGFAGNEGSRTERVAGAGPAVISGDINGDDVFLPTHPTWNENAYHIFTGDEYLRLTEINGVTITHGKASGLDREEDIGSAIYMPEGGELTLTGCQIDDNYCTMEGTIFLQSYASLKMIDSSASGNYSLSGQGVISAQLASRVDLENCDFTGNEANRSGVVGLETMSSLNATDCTFADNTTVGFGAAIGAQVFPPPPLYVNDGIDITLTRCDFLRNQCRNDGGAIYFHGTGNTTSSSLTITDCNFDGNQTTLTGYGGAMFADNTGQASVIATISGTTFNNHVAAEGGGALYFSNLSRLEVTDCTFTGNRSRSNGAAVRAGGGDSSFQRCTFVENESTSGDAALALSSAIQTDIDKCLFVRNSGREWGGALLHGGFTQSLAISNSVFRGNTCREGRGGALMTFAPDVQIVNSLFVGNVAKTDGGGIEAWDSFVQLTNSTVYGNTAQTGSSGGLHGNNSYFAISNSILRGNVDPDGDGPLSQLDGDATTASVIKHSNITGVALSDGNIDSDPLFNDSLGDDGIIGSEDDDYSLSPDSPSIDAGNNALVPAGTTSDLHALDRFHDHPTPDTGSGTPPIVDMGPYEARLADCDHSGAVDLHDHTGFATCMTGPAAPIARECLCIDLNADGTLDLGDFAVLQRIIESP